MTKIYFYTSLLVSLILIVFNASAQLCTFTGGGSGTDDRWSVATNWDCGRIPDFSSDDVVIPAGFSVRNNGEIDFVVGTGRTFTINGSLDLNVSGKKIEMLGTSTLIVNGSLDMSNGNILMKDNSRFNLTGSASVNNVFELFFNTNSQGLFENGTTVVASHLKTDDNSVLTNNTTIEVTSKLENLGGSEIIGTGALDFDCNDSFANNGTGTIFGCSSNTCTDCTLASTLLLPVEFISYSTQANYERKTVEVLWSTATEENSASFVIERSSNGFNFSPIGNVRAAGNSNDIQNYTFSDNSPIIGTTYYRIKQIDIDGTFTYSSVMVQRFKSNSDIGIITLSIEEGELMLNFPVYVESGQLDVINSLGQLVNTKAIKVNAFATSLGMNLKGFYVLRFSNRENTWIRKVFIQ